MNRCDECKHKDSCVCVPYGCECFEIDLEEHDKKVRAETIAKYRGKLETDVIVRAQNCYKTMFNEREQEIFNFATKTFLDAMDYFARQMEEQK